MWCAFRFALGRLGFMCAAANLAYDMAASGVATSTIADLANPCEALCYHILAIVAWGAGDETWSTRAVEMARALARIVVATKCFDEFITGLRDLRDDVTMHYLVTGLLDSQAHGVVPLIQDLLVAWLGDMAAHDPSFSRTKNVTSGVDIPGGLALSTKVAVADVLTYATPLQGVLESDPMGAMPVCVDARVVHLLKRVGVLRVMTQYHEQYARMTSIVDEIVLSFTDETNCTMAVCWQLIAENTDATLWTCLKMDFGELACACALVQSDAETWCAKVVLPTHELVVVPRLEGSGVTEAAENTLFIAALSDGITKKYGDTRLQSPTYGQAVLYLRLLMFRMREKRRTRGAGPHGVPELRYEGGTDEGTVAPFRLRDVIARAAGRGVVVQNAMRSLSFGLVTLAHGDILLLDAQGGTATLVTGDSATQNMLDLDALVMDKKQGALWRATVLQPTERAEQAAAARKAQSRALLEHMGVPWFEMRR